MTSSWFFLSTLNYDARSTTHQIFACHNIHNRIGDAVEMGRRILICFVRFFVIQFSFSAFLIFFSLYFQQAMPIPSAVVLFFLFLLFGGGGAVLKYKTLCVRITATRLERSTFKKLWSCCYKYGVSRLF